MTSFLHPTLAEVFGLGGPELILILLLILLLFGAKRLPGLARGLSESIREFKKGARENEDEHQEPPKPDAKAKAEKTASE